MSKKNTLDTELLDNKSVKKLSEALGPQATKEYVAKSTEELKASISYIHLELEKIDAETAQNDKFQAAQQIVKDFNAAKRDAKKLFKLQLKVASVVVNSREPKK